MFVIEGMEKVRKVIEENRRRKLTKHKKIANNTIMRSKNMKEKRSRKQLRQRSTSQNPNTGVLRPKTDTTKRRRQSGKNPGS